MDIFNELPPEVWRKIFRWSTYNPGALETRVESQLQFHQWRLVDYPQHKRCMVTKRSLVQVCKKWQTMCIELLYEDCRPRNLDKLVALTAVITEQNRSGHENGDGWWIRRLHVPVPDNATHPDSKKEILRLLLDAVQRMPRITILIFNNRLVVSRLNDHSPGALIDALVDYLGNLRYLEADDSNEPRPYPAVQLPFAKLPLLERFGVPRSGIEMVDNLRIGRPFTLEELTHTNITSLTLVCGRHTPNLDLLSFPNLRHLTLPFVHDSHLGKLSSFLASHGTRLETLSIQFRHGFSMLLAPARETSLITACPNVHELMLLDFFKADSGTVAFPKVTSLGISFNYDPMTDDIKTLYRLERFPNLKSVRVIDKKCYQPSPRERAFWKSFLDRGDIIFEDALGREVPLQLPPISIRRNEEEGSESA